MFLPVQKKIRTRMLNSLLILEKMHPDGTNVFAFNVIDKYENRPDNLHSMCRLSVDFASFMSPKRQMICRQSPMRSKVHCSCYILILNCI